MVTPKLSTQYVICSINTPQTLATVEDNVIARYAHGLKPTHHVPIHIARWEIKTTSATDQGLSRTSHDRNDLRRAPKRCAGTNTPKQGGPPSPTLPRQSKPNPDLLIGLELHRVQRPSINVILCFQKHLSLNLPKGCSYDMQVLGKQCWS